MRFKESSHLFVWMRTGVFSDEPWLLRYSFHYMTNEGTTIFRYDNSDHHRGLEHHPNHKHEGANERVIDFPQPSIRAIRDEIVAYLNNLSRS